MLLFLMIMVSAVLFVPGNIAQESKQSAWIIPVFSLVIGFITLLISWKLGQRFPGKTLPQFSQIILGKILGKVFASGYILFFLVDNVLMIREFSYFINDNFLPSTPLIVLNLVILLIAGYAAFKGIEVIARMTQFVLPLFVFSVVFILMLATLDLDWEELLPFFEGGVSPILLSSVVFAPLYGEIVILVMLLPIVNKPEEVLRKGVWMLLIVAGLLTVQTLVTIMVLSSDLTGKLLYPLWYLARYLEIGKIIQRVEFITMFWITAFIVKTALFYYLICFATAQVLSLKSYKKVIFPSGAVQLLAATFLFSNTLQFKGILDKLWPPFGLFFELVLPILLLFLAL